MPIDSISSSSFAPSPSHAPRPSAAEPAESRFGPATRVTLSPEARNALMEEFSEKFPIPAEVPDPVVELEALDGPEVSRENAAAVERSASALGRRLSSVLG